MKMKAPRSLSLSVSFAPSLSPFSLAHSLAHSLVSSLSPYLDMTVEEPQVSGVQCVGEQHVRCHYHRARRTHQQRIPVRERRNEPLGEGSRRACEDVVVRYRSTWACVKCPRLLLLVKYKLVHSILPVTSVCV